ncbi:MAG: protein kinase [Alphaproteobacteria bacterium]|nr:protein kinase [Alphaproteobacteria bacterium]
MRDCIPIRPLGQGSSGSVLLVEDRRRPGRYAALKQLNLDAGPAERDRLRREAALLASCRHPDIPRFITFVEHEHALVMEYIPGEDLRERLEALQAWRRRPRSLEAEVTCIVQPEEVADPWARTMPLPDLSAALVEVPPEAPRPAPARPARGLLQGLVAALLAFVSATVRGP